MQEDEKKYSFKKMGKIFVDVRRSGSSGRKSVKLISVKKEKVMGKKKMIRISGGCILCLILTVLLWNKVLQAKGAENKGDQESVLGYNLSLCGTMMDTRQRAMEVLGGYGADYFKHKTDNYEFGMPSADLVSKSEINNNEYTQSIIDDYSEKYGHEFGLASVELENQLYGVWQAKEFVGGDNSLRVYWDGFYNDIVIFSEDAWFYGESPHYKPVYALYSADFEELKQNIEWKDNRYEDYTAIVGIAVSSEKNNNLGSTEQRILKFIIMEDHIIIERNGSYFRLEKVGEIDLNGLFENVKPY